MRKLFLIGLASLLTTPSLACAETPLDAVRFFYDPVLFMTDPEYRHLFVDPALTKLNENDVLREDGDIGCIDFVLQVNAQDFDDAEVLRSLKMADISSDDQSSVRATFYQFPDSKGEREEILWTLEKVGGTWKVADIEAGSGDWRLSDFDCTAE